MSGALACTLIFSMLEAVVPLELLFSVSVLELSVISSSSCRSEVRVSIWSTTSLSSLATSFRSPRTNSRSSTMILICSFTLVLEAAGGPSAGEDEEGFPLDLADILWGQARQVRTGGRAEAAARPRLWRCYSRFHPGPPTSWALPGQRRMAALRDRPGVRTVVLPSTPETRRSARGCRRAISAPAPPPAAARRSRAHTRCLPAGGEGRQAAPRAVSCSPRRTSLWGLSRTPFASRCGEASSRSARPLVLIPKCPHHRSL